MSWADLTPLTRAQALRQVWDLADGSPVGAPMAGHIDWVRAVGIATWKEDTYVISGSHDRSVRIWDLATGTPTRVLNTRFHDPVIAMTTGTMLGRPIVLSCTEHNKVDVTDVLSGQALLEGAYRSLSALMTTAAGNIDGQCYLVIATYDDTAYLWSPERKQPIRFFFTEQKERGTLMELVGRGGELLLATGGQSGRLTLWQLPHVESRTKARLGYRRPVKLKRVEVQQLSGPVTAIACRGDGSVAVAVGDTIALDPFAPDTRRIQLDARVRTMRFADTDILVVSTVQGLVSIRLST